MIVQAIKLKLGLMAGEVVGTLVFFVVLWIALMLLAWWLRK